jgi:predicted ATPase
MLTNIELKNFKCFNELSVDFARLNVLTGINSVGKSTLIQSILLAFNEDTANKLLFKANRSIENPLIDFQLNNHLLRLGEKKDILYRGSEDDDIIIKTSLFGSLSCRYKSYTKGSSGNSPEMFVVCLDNVDKGLLYEHANLGRQTFYMCADRIGPKPFYPNAFQPEHNIIGVRGEYTVPYLATYGKDDIVSNEAIIHKDETSRNLIDQIQAWLSSIISPNIKFEATKINSNISAINFYYQNSFNPLLDRYTPNNVGFGISYTLPVIVALLKAKKGELLIIENPEAHLHPKGQRLLGELIAKVSSGGVQLIIETHSDHILNGIRLAVKQRNIKPEEVAIDYFYVDNDNKHINESIKVMSDGSLSKWPEGFFDEWDNAVLDLLS